MRILFLAPQPFFQERGTPIAVRLALEVLAAHGGVSVDLLTYHEGSEIEIPHTTLHRMWAPSWLKDIGPGISIKKVLCDLLFFVAALRLMWRSKAQPYELIHAVEESVFIAILFKLLFRVPYLYDMDSSLALQLTEKWKLLSPFQAVFGLLEKMAMRHSVAVVPVCDALAAIAHQNGAPHTHVLSDISLLNRGAPGPAGDLRSEAEIPREHLLLLYIGNLESYQGISLLLESFATLTEEIPNASIAIIGGRPEHISHYHSLCARLGVTARVKFLGPRPVSTLDGYLKQADILLSPRIKGNNTPMKIYSYLHSGKPVVATRLPTHTQVMNEEISFLGSPDITGYAAALRRALVSAELREHIGTSAQRHAEEHYTFDIFSRRLIEIYRKIGERIRPPDPHATCSAP